jgi:hypothetical protein
MKIIPYPTRYLSGIPGRISENIFLFFFFFVFLAADWLTLRGGISPTNSDRLTHLCDWSFKSNLNYSLL